MIYLRLEEILLYLQPLGTIFFIQIVLLIKESRQDFLLFHQVSALFQNTLLQQLGVAPFSEGPWPLYIHPQSLSVLSRLLLIWQHKATAQGDPDVPECLKVWER